MKKIYLLILFLIINFGGLAIGNWLMAEGGPTSQWYLNLNKAPWTPPGWVFGLSWSIIMICFSVYLTYLFSIRNSIFVTIVYGIQVVLNVIWNYVFFNQHFIGIALLVIIALTLVILYFFISFGDDKLSKMKYLLLPYLIWLCIATSLNAYALLNN